MIPLCVPEVRGNEWKYIKECLDTNWVSSVGSFVDRFEQMVANYVGANYTVATVNGTAALHIALLVGGVEPNDEVLVSSLSFIAPANAIRYVGAWPVFVDAEPKYWQMDPEEAVDFLERGCRWSHGKLYNKGTGRRVKAIVPVHILGHPCDMDPILVVARKYDVVVIEDATESLGAKYLTKDRGPQTADGEDQSTVGGRRSSVVGHRSSVLSRWSAVGSLGDIACFSFNGNKIVTAGGGGMIVTNNEEWAIRARYLTTQAKDDPVEYIHKEIGYNYRLTNLQAAMGCGQMEKLDEYIACKRGIAQTYAAALGKVPGITCMAEASWASSTFWMYTILVDEAQYGMNSRSLLSRLGEDRIEARPLWQPLHLSPAHAGGRSAACPVAEKIWRDSLSLPSSVSLLAEEQECVIERLVGFRGDSGKARG
ncbi:MAG: LegC family aminotransferase [Deltaproteobacteria bacterium]|nr:LegC family aminotransferase [Deltaproteobacteria bacterium]